MLTKRIIPCLDVKNGKVVKGINFQNVKEVGNPVVLGGKYAQMGADELVFLDITATQEARDTAVNLIRDVAENVFIPFTIGGGIRSIGEIKRLLEAGADKVSINSAAVLNPALISEASRKFGSQCIVVAVDVKRIADKWKVFISGGTRETDLDAMKWIQKVEKLGAGEILLTSMDRDGTSSGFDIDLYKQVNEMVDIPVIASGGGGAKEHFLELFERTDVSGALAASIFHYGNLTIRQLKDFLDGNNVPVRKEVDR